MNSYRALVQAVLEGDHERTVLLTQEALDRKASPEDIVESGLQAAMAEVGRRFSNGDRESSRR